MLSKLAMVVTGIILLGATAAVAAPAGEFGNLNIEMAVEQGMETAALYTPTTAAPSAFVDDSPALYVPSSSSPVRFPTLDQRNERLFSRWEP